MIHPSRSTSLNNGRPTSDLPYAQPAASAQVVFENGQYQDRPPPTQQGIVPSTKNGLLELAGTRAQLLGIQRRLLEHAGKTMGWSIGWSAILASLSLKEDLAEVDLDSEEENTAEEEAFDAQSKVDVSTRSLGLSAGALATAVSSLGQFRQFYEVGPEPIWSEMCC
jgi:hypothetical protein